MSPERFTSTTELVTELFSRYKSVMIHVALGILKDKQFAEDAASEAMIKIIKNIHMIDDIESRRCANFVYTITKNTALDTLRKKKKEYTFIVTNYTAENVNNVYPNIDFSAFESRYGFSEEMEHFLSELCEMDRDIICMKYGDEFSYIEIAEILEIKEATVRKRISRAKKKLIKIMEKGGNGLER